MELKAHSQVRIIIEENKQEGVRFVEHYEVIQTHSGSAMAVLRRVKVTQGKIVQCPHCGAWGPEDTEEKPKGILL